MSESPWSWEKSEETRREMARLRSSAESEVVRLTAHKMYAAITEDQRQALSKCDTSDEQKRELINKFDEKLKSEEEIYNFERLVSKMVSEPDNEKMVIGLLNDAQWDGSSLAALRGRFPEEIDQIMLTYSRVLLDSKQAGKVPKWHELTQTAREALVPDAGVRARIHGLGEFPATKF